jgi:hypothetical protein
MTLVMLLILAIGLISKKMKKVCVPTKICGFLFKYMSFPAPFFPHTTLSGSHGILLQAKYQSIIHDFEYFKKSEYFDNLVTSNLV